MRIPKYTSKRGVSAPQIRATQVSGAAVSGLGDAINFIQGQYKQGVKQQDEDQKLFYANEKSRVSLEIDTEFAKAQEAIEAGDYGAEKRFQKIFDKTTAESQSRLSGLPVEFQDGARNDYNRAGLESGLRLKKAVNDKMRAETKSNLSIKLDNLGVKMNNAETDAERLNISSEANDAISELEAGNFVTKQGAEELVNGFLVSSVKNQAKNKSEAFLASLDDPGRREKIKALVPGFDKLVADAEKQVAINTKIKDLMVVDAELSKIPEVDAAMADGSLSYMDIQDLKESNPTLIPQLKKYERQMIGDVPSSDEVAKQRAGIAVQYKSMIGKNKKLKKKVTFDELAEFYEKISDSGLTMEQAQPYYQSIIPALKEAALKDEEGFFASGLRENIEESKYSYQINSALDKLEGVSGLGFSKSEVNTSEADVIANVVEFYGLAETMEEGPERDEFIREIPNKALNKLVRNNVPSLASVSDEDMPKYIMTNSGQMLTSGGNTQNGLAPETTFFLQDKYATKKGGYITKKQIEDTAAVTVIDGYQFTVEDVVNDLTAKGILE